MAKRKLNSGVDNNTITGFTWNLNQEQLNLEDGIDLRKSIDFSCKNLEEFKNGIEKEIFDTLGFDVHALKEATERQIDKNEINGKTKIDKIMAKFDREKKRVKSEKSGKSLLQAIKKINDQENEELEKISISLENLDTIQGDLKKQKEYLTILTSTEIWKALLSLPENEAPRIKFNIINYDDNSNTTYEIRKREGYETGDCTDTIRNTIENKLYEISNRIIEENSEECISFAFKYILRPFSTNEGHDTETLKYYTYSILDCIQNKNIIQDIVSEYIVRKDITLRLSELETDMESYENNVEQLNISEKPGIQNNNSEHEIQPIDIWDNIDKLKMRSFISYLESDNNDLKNKEDIITHFKSKFESTEKCEFNEKWLQIDTPILKYNQKSKNQESFITTCTNILKFLNINENKTEKIKTLFNDIVQSSKGKLDYYTDGELLKFLKEKFKFTEKGNDLIGHVNGNEIKIRRYPLKEGLSRNAKIMEYIPDKRLGIINNSFNEIFGIRLKASDLNIGGKNSSELLWLILQKLVSKINEDKKNEINSINNQIKRIRNKRLLEKSDTSSSNIFEQKLKELVNETLPDSLRKTCNSIDIKKEKKELGKLKKFINLDGEKELNKSDIEDIKKQVLPELQDLSATLKGFNKQFEWYANGKNGIYDLNTIADVDDTSKYIKRVLCLTKLFQCDQLTLEDKFYYSKIILGFKESAPDIIESKDERHDSILKNIFGNYMVESNYELGTLSDIKIDTLIVFGKNEVVDVKYIENGLRQTKYKTKSKNNEIVSLSILKAVLVAENSEIEEKRKELNELENSEWQEMVEKEINGIENKYRDNLLTNFKGILEKLGIGEKDLEEIDKLNSLFPGVLENYIRDCLSKQAFMFGKSNYAINYTSGEFNFSVIRAGILEKAVENGNNLDVLLDYLGFFGCEGLNIQKELNVDWFKSTLKSLILCLYENKTGCFDDKYPNNNDWHKLNFQDNIYINRKTGGKNKFCIGEKNDSFRLVGFLIMVFICSQNISQ